MKLEDIFEVEIKIESYKDKLKNMELKLKEKLLEHLKYPIEVDRVNLKDREICFIIQRISLGETSIVYYSLEDKKFYFNDGIKIRMNDIKMILSAIDKTIEYD